MLAKVALPRSARTRTCFLRENPAMDRLVGPGEPTDVARCFAVNAQQAQPLTNVSHPGLTEHALSMPSRSYGTHISKTLRCYKGETLCKPLFSKTVLHWEPVAAEPRGGAISMRFPRRQQPIAVAGVHPVSDRAALPAAPRFRAPFRSAMLLRQARPVGPVCALVLLRNPVVACPVTEAPPAPVTRRITPASPGGIECKL
jgi:hypothetical protein